MDLRRLDFFLESMSPFGFSEYFSKVQANEKNQTVILLKTWHGYGKSSLLRRVSDYLLSQGDAVENIHCAADPNLLDAVLCESRRISIFDATAPHADAAQAQMKSFAVQPKAFLLPVFTPICGGQTFQ